MRYSDHVERDFGRSYQKFKCIYSRTQKFRCEYSVPQKYVNKNTTVYCYYRIIFNLECPLKEEGPHES